MHPTQIVIKPVVTEKTAWQSSGDRSKGKPLNRYTFKVHRKANKHQIRDAVRRLYDVRVVKVATQNRKGKVRRTRFGYSRTADWKRATVELHPEDRIDVF